MTGRHLCADSPQNILDWFCLFHKSCGNKHLSTLIGAWFGIPAVKQGQKNRLMLAEVIIPQCSGTYGHTTMLCEKPYCGVKGYYICIFLLWWRLEVMSLNIVFNLTFLFSFSFLALFILFLSLSHLSSLRLFLFLQYLYFQYNILYNTGNSYDRIWAQISCC